MARALIHHLHQGEVPRWCLPLVVVTYEQLLQLAQRRQLQPDAISTCMQTQAANMPTSQVLLME